MRKLFLSCEYIIPWDLLVISVFTDLALALTLLLVRMIDPYGHQVLVAVLVVLTVIFFIISMVMFRYDQLYVNDKLY